MLARKRERGLPDSNEETNGPDGHLAPVSWTGRSKMMTTSKASKRGQHQHQQPESEQESEQEPEQRWVAGWGATSTTASSQDSSLVEDEGGEGEEEKDDPGGIKRFANFVGSAFDFGFGPATMDQSSYDKAASGEELCK